MKDEVIKLLRSLSAFNVLTKQIVDIITDVFHIDAEALCKKYGITYKT